MKRIAIIPARSGSKGLRDKNIKQLQGKPLLAYSIEAALSSGCFDTVMVSTDSVEYAEIARCYGAEVPFLRSAECSTDTAGSWEVVSEVLDRYSASGRVFDVVALLQPTSPLRTTKDIVASVAMMDELQANAIIGVCESDHSPLWSNTLPTDYSMDRFLRQEVLSTPRQLLPTYYRINGAMYLLKTNYLAEGKDIYRERCFAYVMDKRHSVDIDDEVDFFLASAILAQREESEIDHA